MEEIHSLKHIGFKEENIGTIWKFLGQTIQLDRNSNEEENNNKIGEGMAMKIETLVNRLKKQHHNMISRSIITKAYIGNTFNYYIMTNNLKPANLHKAQKQIDKYINDTRSFTAGKQKYLNIKEGGSGAIHLANQMKAMSLYWLRKLIQEKSLSAKFHTKI